MDVQTIPPPIMQPVATVPQPQMMQMNQPQQMGGGGVTGFLKALNPVEVIVTIAALTALFYIIKYYNFSMSKEKESMAKMQKQIDGTDQKLAAMDKKNAANKRFM